MVEPTTSRPTEEFGGVQDRLAQAIERARVGEDRQLAQEVRERGEQLANLLYGLLRTSRTHDADNRVFDQPIADFYACVGTLTDVLGVINLVTVEEQVYVNDVRVRFGEQAGTPGALGQELRKHNVGGITFHTRPSDQEARALVACFAQPPAGSSPRMALSRSLFKRGVKQIELTGIYRYLRTGESRRAGDDTMADLFERAQKTVGQMWNNAIAGRVLNVLPLRRLVAEILDAGPGIEPLWEPIEDAPPHIAHAMRVNHLSLVIGTVIGFDHAALQDLGVAALLHDLGYAAPDELAGSVANLHHTIGHTVLGARMLACRRGFHEAKVRRVLVALHHHRDYQNRSGTPPPLFGRIVRIAEDYDNYTRPDAGGLSPPEALSAIAGGSGSRYDPALVQSFINVMGRFPPGTLLQLEDGRTVRALCIVRDPSTFDKPRTFVVGEENGWVPDFPCVVDLATEGRAVQVLRTFTPRQRVYR